MQKRHFEAIAEALKARKPEIAAMFIKDTLDEAIEEAFSVQWKGDCEAIADTIEPFITEANESVPEGYKYSREAFLTACGVVTVKSDFNYYQSSY